MNNVLRLTFHIFNEKDRYSRICTEIVVNNTRGLLNNASPFSSNDITCYFRHINVHLREKLRHDKNKETVTLNERKVFYVKVFCCQSNCTRFAYLRITVTITRARAISFNKLQAISAFQPPFSDSRSSFIRHTCFIRYRKIKNYIFQFSHNIK